MVRFIVYFTLFKSSYIIFVKQAGALFCRNLITIQTNPELYELAFGPVIDGENNLLTKFPIQLLNNGESVNFDVSFFVFVSLITIVVSFV